MNSIAAVIITKNEERHILRCLNSVSEVADEIIVVDSFSTDRTPEICRQFPKVYFTQREWQGYSSAKNYGNELAHSDYILSLDADEELSSDLEQEIMNLKSNLSGGYFLNRLTNYCGTWIYHSSWSSDYQLRLFPRALGRWNESEVHERVVLPRSLKTRKMKGRLHHFSINSIDQHMETVNRYTSLAAETIKGKKPSWSLLIKAIIRPPFSFLKNYILRRGFLDGFHGLMIAVISSFYVFLKYAKAYQLHLQDRSRAPEKMGAKNEV